MRKLFSLLVGMLLILVSLFNPGFTYAKSSYWSIQSIDTMKYSRDLAREWVNNPLFEAVIESQVKKIAETGATHVAIGTPYDREFIPFLEKWVSAARKAGLKVWFRGNFSGWEEWFSYPAISEQDHLRLTEEFILSNSTLFENGDIFTSCIECENGQIGDPRQTGKVDEYRQFLIQEYEISKKVFIKIGKEVKSGYFSMNADVARLIMNEETTQKLGGVVVIDHYVKDPEKLAQDIREISEYSGGRIFLGEYGVPIPDIHGRMNEKEQAEWIAESMNHLVKEPSLSGINYWVSFGGTTAVWNNDGTEKPAVSILRSYFSPNIISGKVINDLGKPVRNALIIADSKQSSTNNKGEFEIPTNPSLRTIVVKADAYKEKTEEYSRNSYHEIVIEKEREELLFKYHKFVYRLVKTIKNKWFN